MLRDLLPGLLAAAITGAAILATTRFHRSPGTRQGEAPEHRGAEDDAATGQWLTSIGTPPAGTDEWYTAAFAIAGRRIEAAIVDWQQHFADAVGPSWALAIADAERDIEADAVEHERGLRETTVFWSIVGDLFATNEYPLVYGYQRAEWALT